MYYSIHGYFRPDSESKRAAVVDMFTDHIGQRHGCRVRLGGPLYDAARNRIGALLIVEAPSLEAVNAFSASSPYLRAGLYDRLQIDEVVIEAGSFG